MRATLILLIFLFSFLRAHAESRAADFASSPDLSLHRNQFYAAPEVYQLKRTKKGGGKQKGVPFAIRLGYDRLKRYGWYWGVEGSSSWGSLHGHSGSGIKNRSRFSDCWMEGRGGYTFQQKEGSQASLTPFVGLGYLEEKNHFTSPSHLKIHFKTKCPFATAGFLFWMKLNCAFELGFNFKARYPLDPECKITHDKAHDNFSQLIKERIQYRIDLPLTYRLNDEGSLAVAIAPFWENRAYGTRLNYPFDFLKTEFQFWGVSLQFFKRF